MTETPDATPLAQQPAASALPALTSEETRDLLKTAIQGGGVEAIERVVALYDRTQERAAARAYHDAMAQFAGGVEPVPKKQSAKIVTKKGSNFSYKYAGLEDIAIAIKEPLQAAGLAYTWDSDVADGRITVTCTVRHIDGHAATAKFICPIDTSAAMSEQQKVAAALTFGRRQSLIQALGLTACDPDDDGADPEDLEPITESQALDLETLVVDSGADKARFLTFMGVTAIEDIPAAQYARAEQSLRAKAGKLL